MDEVYNAELEMHRKIIGVIQKTSEDFQSALALATLNKITGIKKIDKCI